MSGSCQGILNQLKCGNPVCTCMVMSNCSLSLRNISKNSYTSLHFTLTSTGHLPKKDKISGANVMMSLRLTTHSITGQWVNQLELACISTKGYHHNFMFMVPLALQGGPYSIGGEKSGYGKGVHQMSLRRYGTLGFHQFWVEDQKRGHPPPPKWDFQWMHSLKQLFDGQAAQSHLDNL